MEQKFKRGNLVHIADQLPAYMSHFESGVDVIISASYAEQYGGEDTQNYTVIFPETGNQISWYPEQSMTLVGEGGEHLIEQAQEKRKHLKELWSSIPYIKDNMESSFFSSDSVLVLFDLLGYEPNYITDDGFFQLQIDWLRLKPLFIHIRNSKTLEEAESWLNEEGKKAWTVDKVFEAFNKE